jgi:spore maturation protein CgeB
MRSKIFYAVYKYDYGKKELGFGFEHCNFYDSLSKMNNASNEIIYFPVDEISEKVGREKMNEQLLDMVSKEKPDLCFFSIFKEELKKEVIKKISGICPTFNWFIDDKWRFDNFSKYWAPYFTWVSTTENSALEKYKKLGFKNVIKTQFACNHFLYKPLDLPKIYGATFVGQPHANREKIVEKLKRKGVNILCWGRGWPNGRVSQEEMTKIFCQSKINLNFTKCSGKITLRSLAGIFLEKDGVSSIKVKNPLSWIDNLKSFIDKQKHQIKGRSFEVPGLKSFVLTDYSQGLEEYYEIGKEIVCWENIDDLSEKIEYYLKNEDEREKIAEAGYERTIRDHTYEKRFNDIFKIIGISK